MSTGPVYNLTIYNGHGRQVVLRGVTQDKLTESMRALRTIAKDSGLERPWYEQKRKVHG